ncbi:MAG TPA: Na/Pi symporter [Candidatus Saccharimonadales bacterium]|nr:Na/Pi symporter [Candidatus Saccharimonadales bacterium]
MSAPTLPYAAIPGKRRSLGKITSYILLILSLYAFLVSIGMLSKAFKLMGGGFVDGLLASATNPVIGLFVGILATTLVQSSSSTTSLVVAMVGGGTMSVATAIPVIMGANIGTSVTNTLVSLGHMRRGREFRRAFAASTVHDFFNIFSVLVLFPLQIATNFLGGLSSSLASLLERAGGLTFTSPLKTVTAPAVSLAVSLLGSHPVVLLIASAAILFLALHRLVVVLKALVVSKAESLFDQVIFRNPGRAMAFGLLLTVLVQSSSITTSLVVPLAGAGLLSLRQIFPYTLGANVGTTVTAILASLAVGEVNAVTVAFAHLLFNVCGILLVWPLPVIRRIPMRAARGLARLAIRSRLVPLLYILIGFYLGPLLVILLLR